MRFGLLIVLVFALFSCKKEPTTWDGDFNAPLLRTEMTLANLLPDSLLDYDANNNVSIVIDEEILNIGLDSIMNLVGDTIEKDFSIAPIIEFEFQPGNTFISENDEFEFDNIDAQFREAKIKTGQILLFAENTVPSDLEFIISIPGATLNDVPFEELVTVPAGTSDQNGTLYYEFDFSQYHLDLTGESGNSYNTLDVHYQMAIPADASPVTIYNTDFVNLKMSYESLEIEYAFGYLGSQELDLDENTDFKILEELNNAVIDVDSSTAQLSLTNGFGVDISAIIYQLKAWNTGIGNEVSLSHPLIGSSINLSRSFFDYKRLIPFEKTYSLDRGNSNLDDLIELIPDSIRIQAEATLNPFGNISNFNDFAVDQSRLACNLKINIPLNVSLSNLVLSDTLDYDWELENPDINSATLYVVANNSFPAEVAFSIICLDENHQSILSLDEYLLPQSSEIISGRIGEQNGESILAYQLSEETMALVKEGHYLAFSAEFQTTGFPDLVRFQATDVLDILISADANLKMEVE